MADPLSLIESLKALSLIGAAHETLEQVEPIMADLNVAQMRAGKRADGSYIEPPYRPLTIDIKKGKPGLSGVYDHVTLFDEGDFQSSLYAQVTADDRIEFGATDKKSDDLEEKYSDLRASKFSSTSKNIFGLNENSREELKGDSLPIWQGEIEKATGLKFD
jgi:hypothetical protein